MPEIDGESMVILKSPSRVVSFAVPDKGTNSRKRAPIERGRISLHIDSLDLKKYQPASDASLSISVFYSGKEGTYNKVKFQTPFLDLNKAQQDTLTWSENITLPDPRHSLAKPRLCFEILMSTRNRFLISKKAVIGRSEPHRLDSLLGHSDEEVMIPFTTLLNGVTFGPVLRIKTRRLAPVPVQIKKIGK